MYGARASTGNLLREPGDPLHKSRKNSKKTQQPIISLGAGRPAPCHAEIEQTIADHARMKRNIIENASWSSKTRKNLHTVKHVALSLYSATTSISGSIDLSIF
jgi:hypothetical protein